MSYWSQPSLFESEAEARFEQKFGLAPPSQTPTARSQATASQDRGAFTASRFRPALQAIRRTREAQEHQARAHQHVDGNGTPFFPDALHGVQPAASTHPGGIVQSILPGTARHIASPNGPDPFMSTPGLMPPPQRNGPVQRNGRLPPPRSFKLPQQGQSLRPPALLPKIVPSQHTQPALTTAAPQRPLAVGQPMLPVPPPASSFVQVRKGRNGSSNITGSPFAAFQKNRPPYNVQPPLGIDIGLREICVFMPDWLHIAEVVVRFLRNGATRALLAKMQLLPTDELTPENYTRCKNKIQQQFGDSGKLYYGIAKWDIGYARVEGAQNDLTASTWATHRKGGKVEFEHMKLVDIYSPIPAASFPTGRDRLLLTQCLEYARNNPHLDLDTSHFDWIIQSQGLQAPAPPIGQNRDQEAIAAFDKPNPVWTWS